MTTNTVSATEAELRSVTEVLQLAAFLDDRAPNADKARIAAWAEQIHRHLLEPNDLLDAVQRYYDRPSDRPIGIGDVISGARAIKRDRLDREEDALRDARRAQNDTKAANEVHLTVMAGGAIGPTKNRTDRLIKAEIALQCATGKNEAQHAIREFLAARKDAKDSGTKANGQAAS